VKWVRLFLLAILAVSCSGTPRYRETFDCVTGLTEYEIDGRPYLYCVSEIDGAPHFFWLDEAEMDADGVVSDAWVAEHELPPEWFDDHGFPLGG
jgi:hypothetical protein